MQFIQYFSLFSFIAVAASGAPQFVRYTHKEDKNAALEHVLEVVNAKVGLQLTAANFIEIEKRKLATSRFEMYAQAAANLPIRGQNIRIWKKADGTALQVEANVDAPPSELLQLKASLGALADMTDAPSIVAVAKEAIRQRSDDTVLKSIVFKDEWFNDEVVRTVKARGTHGVHMVTVSLSRRAVVDYRYQEFPQGDLQEEIADTDTFDIPVKVYPIWEEYEGVPTNLKGRVLSKLKYVKKHVRTATSDPYLSLQTQHYLESNFDPIKGLTEEGRKQGFWAMGYLKQVAADIHNKLPLASNHYKTNGVLLNGKYVTVSLHPSALKLQGLAFQPGISPQFHPNWHESTFKPGEFEMTPESVYAGRPLAGPWEALNRKVERDANHDPVKYINAGFDELQVYWSVTQMFESLRPMGFTDPELSTRPFHAFLYDTDISMKNNAYYTDDTINFTTYSGKEHNMARDNTTIWHELGHGVMDRLMGDHIILADTGGLSEGMADFIAQLALNDITGGKKFVGQDKLRVLNHTGFNLTNEVHDDGEAYGGAMNDMLVAAMKAEGKKGLKKVTDLTLEAMRLTRNHPGLTANGWFEHMLFADENGSTVRKPGELKALILKALAGRNYTFDNSAVASYSLKNGADEVTSTGPGSRNNPIKVPLAKSETVTHELTVGLQSIEAFKFQYPVTVKVQLRGGPIQGAIHWNEEADPPLEYQLASESDLVKFNLTATGECDEVNRPDGSCVDFAYIQIWNNGASDKPVAKKRFYLRIMPKS